MSSDLHSNASGVDLHEDKRIKQPARVVSTANVNITAPGATIDGVTLTSGDRMLLTGQTLPATNGIYIWNGAASTATRSTDAATAFDFFLGFLIYVSEGTSYANSVWLFTTTSAITLGSTSLAFEMFSATGPTGPTGPTGQTGPTGPQGITTLIVSGAPPYIMLADQKTQNTDGGTFSNGADRTRTLNTIVHDTNSYALLNTTSSQFTIPAGTWQYEIGAPAYNCGRHQAMLFDVGASQVVKRGQNAYSLGTAESNAFIKGIIGIADARTYEVRHRCETSSPTIGLGVATNFGTETYTLVELWLIGAPPPPPGRQSWTLPTYRRRQDTPQPDYPPSSNCLLPT